MTETSDISLLIKKLCHIVIEITTLEAHLCIGNIIQLIGFGKDPLVFQGIDTLTTFLRFSM